MITFGNYLIILPSKREIERKAAREERKKTRVTSPNRISMLSYYMNWNVYFIARASINWVAYKSIACILMRVQNIQFVTVRCVGVCVSVTSSEFACATFLINSFLILSSIHTANCQAHHVHIHMTVTLFFLSLSLVTRRCGDGLLLHKTCSRAVLCMSNNVFMLQPTEIFIRKKMAMTIRISHFDQVDCRQNSLRIYW